MDKKATYIILITLLLIAAVLRLIHPLQIPYTYDELGALARTHYSSFSELIDKGIIIDAHPAGVQVFLFYWTRLFGDNELVVKLPFIICGILAVYFIFRLAAEWYNNTVALVCAAYMATLEYTVMYSQIARPYIIGLFFTLAMVFYWSKALFKPEERFNRNILLYILFSSLCSYTHHFSLLMAGMVGFTGLLFVQKKYTLKYILAGILIFILYIPHLHIFFYQLGIGGIGGPDGWLAKPKNTFIIDYIKYVFHFSRSVTIIVILLLVFGIYSTSRKGFSHKNYFFISFAWFIIPFLTGFLYSIYRNPVLQYSVLIFSFPFLLFCLFGWLPNISFIPKSVIILVICAINVFSLVHTRKYYSLFYETPYKRNIFLNDSLLKAKGPMNYAAIIQADDSDRSISGYYIRKYHTDSTFTWMDNLGCFITHPHNYLGLIHFMEQQKKPYFFFGCTSQFDPVTFEIIRTYYPYLVKKWNLNEGNSYLLTNDSKAGKSYPYVFESVNNFEQPAKYWQEADKKYVSDSVAVSGRYSYKMNRPNEWAPAFSCELKDMTLSKMDIIDVSIELYPLEPLNDVEIVSEIDSHGKTIDWRSTPVKKCIPDSLNGKWAKAYHSIKLADIPLNYADDIIVKIYIWNRGKKSFFIDNFSVRTLKGNPIIYGLWEKI